MTGSESRDFYYAIGKERKGPVGIDELKRLALTGDLSRGDKIWTKGMAEWIPAGECDEVFADLPPDLEVEESGPPAISGSMSLGAGQVEKKAIQESGDDKSPSESSIAKNSTVTAAAFMVVWLALNLLRSCYAQQ